MKKILISTITYQRPEGLNTLLKSLTKQISSNRDMIVEICVVDNACMDKTDAIISRYHEKPFNIKLLKESKKGIVYARNCAVNYFLSKDFDAMIFIDDDEWTKNEFWLENLFQAYLKTNADIVTSDVFSIPENDSIKWTAKALDRQKYISDLHHVKNFYTGNVFLKRKVLETIKPAFDERFALTGSSDLHFCMKCRKAGFKIIYTDQAPAYEIFPKSRANIKWFFLRGFRNGSGASRSEIYTSDNKIKAVLKCLFYAAARLIKGIIILIKAGVKTDKGLYATGVMRVASSIGTVLGLFGVTYEEYKIIHGK